jgi:hypothetical protein
VGITGGIWNIIMLGWAKRVSFQEGNKLRAGTYPIAEMNTHCEEK